MVISRWLAAIVMSAVVLAAGVPVAAQGDTTEPPCHSPEAAQFDFWLGEWNLTWGDSGKGTNKITKVLDGCVILENFDGAPSMQFRGWSVSSFDVATGEWKQTWVDNQGGYLDFIGGFADGKMTLSRETTIEGKPALQRMVFSNIGENDLDWNWERSLDGGGPGSSAGRFITGADSERPGRVHHDLPGHLHDTLKPKCYLTPK